MSNAAKITAFARAVGADFKSLRDSKAEKTALAHLEQQFTTLQQQVAQGNAEVTTASMTQAIEAAKEAVKSEIMGGAADATLDTIVEIGNKLKAMEADESISSAITQKLTELRQQIEAVETSVAVEDLVVVYNAAKA